jgi:ribosomal protein S18 acetylase RimI-like enzyme
MKIKLPIHEMPINSTFRAISENDSEILGEIMLEAYRGTIDSEGETLEDAIEEAKGTLDGKYGKFLWDASMIAVVDSHPAAAILFTWSEKDNMPLLAFSMTHVKFKGQGLATKLIKAGLSKLSESNHKECCLVVTEGNEPAFSIYKKIGFQVQ